MSLKLLFVPFSIIFLVVFGIFWIYPEYVVVQEKNDAIAKNEEELRENQVMSQNGEKLAQDLQENKEKKDLLLKVLPRQKEEEKVLWFVSQLAQNSGITLTQVSISESNETVEVGSSTQTMGEAMAENADAGMGDPSASAMSAQKNLFAMKYGSVTFSAAGSYESFQKFLSSIKKVPRILREDTISIEVKKEEKGDPLFQMSGTISFAYAPLKRVDVGTISPVFKQASFDFGDLQKKQQEFDSYQEAQEVPFGRPNPFVP